MCLVAHIYNLKKFARFHNTQSRNMCEVDLVVRVKVLSETHLLDYVNLGERQEGVNISHPPYLFVNEVLLYYVAILSHPVSFSHDGLKLECHL